MLFQTTVESHTLETTFYMQDEFVLFCICYNTFQIDIQLCLDSFSYSAEVEGDWSVIMAENVVIHQAVGPSRWRTAAGRSQRWGRPTVGRTWWCDGWRRRRRGGGELRQPPITEALRAAATAAAGRRRWRHRIRTQRAVKSIAWKKL